MLFSMYYCTQMFRIITLLYVFQRYGYDGFVQLHHHCKVSQTYFFLFCFSLA